MSWPVNEKIAHALITVGLIFSMLIYTGCSRSPRAPSSTSAANCPVTSTLADPAGSATAAPDASPAPTQASAGLSGGQAEVTKSTAPTAAQTAAHPSATAMPVVPAGTVTGTTDVLASAATNPAASPAPVATTAAPTIVQVTIPEGYTLAKICLLLESKGVSTFSKLFGYATTADFSAYAFLPSASATTHRCFRLEGYLYPDTYTFYINENPASVWKRFLDNFASRADGYAAAAAGKGLTLDQAVTIASLIEKEATAGERANVSAVIHNRLVAGMSLDLDSTLTYYQYVIGEYAANPTSYRDYYYTYNFRGLPAGAIGNPGQAAIQAAINPSGLTALYFFTSKAGTYVYSDTYAEHLAKYQADQGTTPTTAAGG